MKKERYLHKEDVHNMKDPNVIVPIVLDVIPFKIRSVVDFGCGLGTWLRAFKEHGVDRILGLDGEWCNKELLFKNIGKSEFLNVDLEKNVILSSSFDLVVCLEVAEHLSEKSADIFVHSLVSAGKIILFSAAFPGQGGMNHINEQKPLYWISRFEKYGYKVYDVIRPKIVDNGNIFPWYKQNMILFVHSDLPMPIKPFYSDKYMCMEYYEEKQNAFQVIDLGHRGISYYFLRLIKSIIYKFCK